MTNLNKFTEKEDASAVQRSYNFGQSVRSFMKLEACLYLLLAVFLASLLHNKVRVLLLESATTTLN